MSANYLKITYTNNLHQDNDHHPGILPFCNSEIYTRSIINHRKLTSGDDVKDVYECSIDLSDFCHNIAPGDAIGILPHNNTEEVELLLDLLGLNEDYYEISILDNTTKKKPVIPAHIPTNGSVVMLFTQCLDIRSVPKKIFLKMLAEYTTNQEEKDQLLKLSTPKDDTYNNFIENEGRTLLTLLRKFPSCKPPLERLLEHLPSLKPRFYSISSKTETNISITFSVINIFDNIDTPDNKTMIKGICSSYLQKILLNNSEKSSKISFYFRQSTNFLQFDKDFNSPLILIGPGTGIAPFKGFLEELKASPDKKHKFDIYVFFGCRYSERDFLYKEELTMFVEKGVVKKLFTAFSREALSAEKVYVQDKLVENGDLIARLLLSENGCLCVCGDAKNLVRGVDNALGEVLKRFGGLDDGECCDFLKEIKKCGRYRIDSWI